MRAFSREVMPADGPDGSVDIRLQWERQGSRRETVGSLGQDHCQACSEMSDMGHFGCRSNRTSYGLEVGAKDMRGIHSVYSSRKLVFI